MRYRVFPAPDTRVGASVLAKRLAAAGLHPPFAGRSLGVAARLLILGALLGGCAAAQSPGPTSLLPAGTGSSPTPTGTSVAAVPTPTATPATTPSPTAGPPFAWPASRNAAVKLLTDKFPSLVFGPEQLVSSSTKTSYFVESSDGTLDANHPLYISVASGATSGGDAPLVHVVVDALGSKSIPPELLFALQSFAPNVRSADGAAASPTTWAQDKITAMANNPKVDFTAKQVFGGIQVTVAGLSAATSGFPDYDVGFIFAKAPG